METETFDVSLGDGLAFAIVPEAILTSGLGAAVVTWALISRYAGRERSAWPSVATLASRLGVSRRTVQRHITELRRAGWLTVHPRATPGGRQTSSRYVLHATPGAPEPSPPASDVASTGEGDKNVTGEGDKNVTPTTLKESQIEGEKEISCFSPLTYEPSDVERVFRHWVGQAHRAGAIKIPDRQRMTPSRVQKIRRRLADGYTVDELCAAITAACASSFHQQEARWLELASILGSSAKVDRHLIAAGALEAKRDRDREGVATAARVLGLIGAT